MMNQEIEEKTKDERKARSKEGGGEIGEGRKPILENEGEIRGGEGDVIEGERRDSRRRER